MPSASSLQIRMDGTLVPASSMMIPVLPTLEISASFFCDSPASSLASRKTSASVWVN